MTVKSMIRDHRLTEGGAVRHYSSPNVSKNVIVPRFIVMHYTGSFRADSAIQWMLDENSKVSAHLVIDRDGSVSQLVDFNRRAWHAGPSYHSGWCDLNSHSIGIEFANLGQINPAGGSGVFRNELGASGDFSKRMEEVTQGEESPGVWRLYQHYTDEQLHTAEVIVRQLVETYPTIFDCVGHKEIDTRGKKKDPGPLFPMARFDSIVSSRSNGELVYEAITRLNVRAGPGPEYPILEVAPDGARVSILSQHSDPMWKVSFTGKTACLIGFVHKDFLRRVQ